MDIYYSLFTFPWAIVYVLTLVVGILLKFSKDRKDYLYFLQKVELLENNKDTEILSIKFCEDYIKTHKFSFFNDTVRIRIITNSLFDEKINVDYYNLIKNNYFWSTTPQEFEGIIVLCFILYFKVNPKEYKLFLSRLENSRKMKNPYRKFRRLTDTNNLEGILSDQYNEPLLQYLQCLFAERAAKKKGLENSEEFLKKADEISTQDERISPNKENIISLVERFDKENE